MADILFIKTSSLGDVVHHMPALSEARKARPDASFTWLVEEAFAPLVALHPAAGAVIPVAWRRWRKSMLAPSTLGEIAGSLRAIRARRYDIIVDSQGLLRSAVIARFARGRRHGYGASSIREPLASLFYDVRHDVSRALHAVERNRMLSGLALGYAPQGAPDFGLDRARFAASGERYAVLLHATAEPRKLWPETNWIALGKALGRPHLDAALGYASRTGAQRASRRCIAARACAGARAARRRGAADRRRKSRRRRRYRAAAFGRRARRAAGGDLCRQQAGSHRPGRLRADRGAGRGRRAACGRGGEERR